ncbi:hypothetical protein PIB30_044149 [Stylosanthes scabra]|uniref:Uncharacterized protein n=1 Tax=Stylosanthes scabra TaxID=79078 RepID=A0ABU6VDN0_9FABA|nr:hypothetical protein [Stylosanthes scabra]
MAENLQGDQAAAEAVQMPHELPSIYRWVTNDVLGSPSILNQQVEAARRGERVCFLNLDHPIVPNWPRVNEVMFTEFEVWVPFSNFQQRLLSRASDLEVFLYLFKFYSSNTSGKTKKRYMSVRPSKNCKIFGLCEDSFHDFKGHYFKIFPVVSVTYQRLNAEQRDTEEARRVIVEMAGNDVTIARLRNLLRPPQAGVVPGPSSSIGRPCRRWLRCQGTGQLWKGGALVMLAGAKTNWSTFHRPFGKRSRCSL